MISDTVTESIKIALEQLHAERARVNAAILKLETFLSQVGELGPDADPSAIERLALGMPTRRKRSTAGWTSDKRHAAADRMRRYWSERRARGDDGSAEGGDTSDGKKRGTAGWTDDKRRAAADRMRKYWAERGKDSDDGQSGAASS